MRIIYISTEFGGLRPLGEVECRLDILALEERLHITLHGAAETDNGLFLNFLLLRHVVSCPVLSCPEPCLGKVIDCMLVPLKLAQRTESQ